MKVLHITSHLGGGVGTVIMGWMGGISRYWEEDYTHEHRIACLDYANDKAYSDIKSKEIDIADEMIKYRGAVEEDITWADVTLVHYWDNPLLMELFSEPIPPCRLVFWHHNNIPVPPAVRYYPDVFVGTSPIQGYDKHIWSTGGVDRFLKIQPKEHEGFNIGYVGWVDYRKMHPNFIEMCKAIDIPDVRFTIVGKNNIGGASGGKFTFTGLVDDVAPYLAEMDVFFYPLKKDHFGTSEQVISESLAAGVVPVVMNNPCEKEILNNGENGFIARNEKEAVDCIEYLYHNKKNREWMSGNSRTKARLIYDINKMIYQWDSIFEEMMESPKKQRGLL